MTEAGEVIGRERAAISWHGKDGKTFATEEREVTAYAAPGRHLIDWSTVLTTSSTRCGSTATRNTLDSTSVPLKKLLGTARKTPTTCGLTVKGRSAIRVTGTPTKAKIVKDPRTINLPWNAMSFVIGGKRYTVLRIDHPANPKETRGSERDYGRFGDYFEYDLTPSHPLKLKYRVWVQEGEMTVEQCEAMAAAFAAPPAVKLSGT